jgi:two-component system, NtrC family, response regulator AtoC
MGLSTEAVEKLLAYSWPGNIRELQNCIERAVSLTRHHEIQVEDLPARVASFRRSRALAVSGEPPELVTMEEVERRYIHRVLQAVHGNKREAAKVLGFDRKTLYRKLERYGIEVDRGARG